jgi:hypothetical protein
MALGLAGPALADVTVTVDVSKDKNISVTETLTVTKIIFIDIEVDLELDRAAEAMALVNQGIAGNLVDRNTAIDGGIDNLAVVRAALIGIPVGGGGPGSISDNDGVTGVNQDVGVMTNQGNIWSIALTEDDPLGPDTFTDAQAEVDQSTTNNSVDLSDGVVSTDPLLSNEVIFLANIEDSVNDNVGLTAVNQNSGSMNNQANAVAVAAGLFFDTDSRLFDGAAVALAEAALGQETTSNIVLEGPSDDGHLKLATVLGSVSGNVGITQVNQSTANMGNQGNVVAVGAAILAPQL